MEGAGRKTESVVMYYIQYGIDVRFQKKNEFKQFFFLTYSIKLLEYLVF